MPISCPPDLVNLGFLHFGEDGKSDPIASLRAALQTAIKSEQLDNSLIVLPEAFNLRNGYWNHDRRWLDDSVAGRLKTTSAEFEIAFLAGLIEQIGGRTYSAAYLIDGAVSRLLSRKTTDDRSGNYECSENVDRPCLYRGLCIAALVCVDATGFNDGCMKDQHRVLLERINALETAPRVLCVPAHIMEYDTKSVARRWPDGISVIISNSYPHVPSVVRTGADVISAEGCENVICTTTVGSVTTSA